MGKNLGRYKVATFYHPNPLRPKPTRSKISAYTVYYSPEWDGCIEYNVLAESGTKAKKIAISCRLDHELHLMESQ